MLINCRLCRLCRPKKFKSEVLDTTGAAIVVACLRAPGRAIMVVVKRVVNKKGVVVRKSLKLVGIHVFDHGITNHKVSSIDFRLQCAASLFLGVIAGQIMLRLHGCQTGK